MNSHAIVFSGISTLALTAGLALMGTPALATQSDATQQASKPAEQLTVVAPRIMHSEVYTNQDGVEGHPVLTLSRRVSYADLDLTQPADAKTLDKRVDAAANQICADLAKARPAVSKSLNCVDKAIQGATQQAKVAIAAAALASAKQ